MLIIDPVKQAVKVKALEEDVIELKEQVDLLETYLTKLCSQVETLSKFLLDHQELIKKQAILNELGRSRFENIESILELIRKLRELDEDQE